MNKIFKWGKKWAEKRNTHFFPNKAPKGPIGAQ